MRNLLWKDFWQNSHVLLAIGIFAAIPYVVVIGSGIGEMLLDGSHSSVPFYFEGMCVDGMRGASSFSLGLCILLAAFLGGNGIAGERADRSAEFAVGLPIRRDLAVISKVIVAAVPCLVMWAVNAAVWIAARQLGVHVNAPDFRHSGDDWVVLPFCLVGIVAMFGFGWICSSLLRNPAIAALAAIGTAVGFLVAVRVVDAAFRGDAEPPFALWFGFFVFVLLLGLLSVAAGAVVYRFRVEP